MPRILLHVVAQDLVNAFLERDGLAGLHVVAGNIGLLAVHNHMPVRY